MDVKWKLSILVDAFHKSQGVSCSIQVTDLFRNVWTKHAFTIAFYKPTCPAGFPPAEILFRRVSLVEPWTDLNGPLAVSFGIVKSAQIGSKWGPDAQIPALSALPCLALYIHWSLDQKLAQWKRPSDPSHKLSAPLCEWLVVLCHSWGCALDTPAPEAGQPMNLWVYAMNVAG